MSTVLEQIAEQHLKKNKRKYVSLSSRLMCVGVKNNKQGTGQTNVMVYLLISVTDRVTR